MAPVVKRSKILMLIGFAFQHTASSVESSAATQSTWPRPRPQVAYRRMWPRTWTTALLCGPTLCAPGGRRAAAEATWSTILPSSASRSCSLNTTAPATGRPPRPKRPAPPARLCQSCATTRVACWGWDRVRSRRNTPTVDYSETRTYGRFAMSFKPARWRGRGL